MVKAFYLLKPLIYINVIRKHHVSMEVDFFVEKLISWKNCEKKIKENPILVQTRCSTFVHFISAVLCWSENNERSINIF